MLIAAICGGTASPTQYHAYVRRVERRKHKAGASTAISAARWSRAGRGKTKRLGLDDARGDLLAEVGSPNGPLAGTLLGVMMPRTKPAVGRTLLSKQLNRGWSLGGTSIVQRGRRFSVVAYAGVDPETHKQRYKWFGGFKTRREAEQFSLTLAHNPSFSAGAGPYGSPRLRTGDYLDRWLHEREVLGEIRPKTADLSGMLVRRHIAPAIGHVPLARLAPPAIQHLYVSLLGAGLSRSTVQRVAQLLHAGLATAVRRGLVAKNPCDNTTAPSREPFDPTILTPEQLQTYLDDAEKTTTPAMYALYVTMAGTGARLGELLGLPEANVDLRARQIHLYQTLGRAGKDPVFGPNKTRRGRRTILLPDEAVEAVRAALVWKKERKLRLGPKFHDAGLVFCGRRGRPINPSNLRNRDHYPRLVRLGLPRIRPHDLRHLHATYLVAAGVDPRTVADRLGHASPSFTLATYAHAAAKAQERAASIANELLMKTGQSGR